MRSGRNFWFDLTMRCVLCPIPRKCRWPRTECSQSISIAIGTFDVEVDADEDRCAVTGEYSPNLPSIAGRYRISEYGVDYIATVRAIGRISRPTRLGKVSRQAHARHSPPSGSVHLFPARYSRAAGSWPCWWFTTNGRTDGPKTKSKTSDWLPADVGNRSSGPALPGHWPRARIGLRYRWNPPSWAPSIARCRWVSIVWNAKCKEHFWLPEDAEIDFDLFYSILHDEDRERSARPSSGQCFTANRMTSNIAPWARRANPLGPGKGPCLL